MTIEPDDIDQAPAARHAIRSRNDIIYEVVRDRICLREYAEGHVIHEIGLANEFRVSRTPIRQALQRLVHEQFAETRNGVGTIVAPENPDLDETWRFWIGLIGLIADSMTLHLPQELESEYARLETLAERLGETAPAARAWPIWRGIHEARLGMIGDEVIRQMGDLLFYRTARLWCRWWTENPASMGRLLMQELRDSRADIVKGERKALFRRHAMTLQALVDSHGMARP